MKPVPLKIPWAREGEASALRDREWLVTNGLGGFASGSVLGVPTRRYHGVFVPNLAEPKGRYVTVPRLDELFDTPDGRVNLGGAEFADGSSSGAAHRHLVEFRLEAMTPVWLFEIEGSLIERSIVMPHGRNAVCVRWRLLDGAPRRMRLRLYAGARRQDAELVCDEATPCTLQAARGGTMSLRLAGSGIEVRLRMLPAGTKFAADPHTDRDVLFCVERERGYDHREHQHSPGYWTVELREGEEAAFFASCGEDESAPDPQALFDAEQARLGALLEGATLAGADELAQRLALAADQFIVLPGSRREAARANDDSFRSVMAGYHWFNDWGRDTMISLEGLALCTGRFEEGRAILRTFAAYVRDGLIPNLFPEGGREALYHTVDATLWYFHALDRYLARTGDESVLAELYPVLAEVVEHHLRGTRFGIGVDPADGLVHAAEESYQLTWMDAKVDGWVVTPRRGKPVEIQALWYNALRLMGHWARRLGASGAGYDMHADKVQAAFEARFWSKTRGYLFDVVDGPDGDDASLRPNQIFALSLPHPVLDPSHWRDVLDAVAEHLLTPIGLRTLAPFEPGYRRRYEGALRERDAAYHQGTVWPWLLGPFVDAWIRVHGKDARARALLREVPRHLLEAGVGSVSEVFDGDPPHRPGGCIAQAWSVAELLRAWLATRPREDDDG